LLPSDRDRIIVRVNSSISVIKYIQSLIDFTIWSLLLVTWGLMSRFVTVIIYVTESY